MTTIKALYDQGQRQFPMRGGGISPPLKFIEASPLYEGFPLEPDCGTVGWNWEGRHFSDLESSIDLLPEPLPDTQAKLERIEAAFDLVEQYILYDARYNSIAYNSDFKALSDAIKAAGGVK